MKESASTPLTASIIEHIDKVRDEASKYIAPIIEKKEMYVSSGITLRSVVLKGIPVEKILEYAEKEKVDLTILGNLGGEKSRNQRHYVASQGVYSRELNAR